MASGYENRVKAGTDSNVRFFGVCDIAATLLKS